jgi:hypothetical protein
VSGLEAVNMAIEMDSRMSDTLEGRSWFLNRRILILGQENDLVLV